MAFSHFSENYRIFLVILSFSLVMKLYVLLLLKYIEYKLLKLDKLHENSIENNEESVVCWNIYNILSFLFDRIIVHHNCNVNWKFRTENWALLKQTAWPKFNVFDSKIRSRFILTMPIHNPQWKQDEDEVLIDFH